MDNRTPDQLRADWHKHCGCSSPYPSIDPCINLCVCGHVRAEHDVDGDLVDGSYRMSYGMCEVDGCACTEFRHEEYYSEE